MIIDKDVRYPGNVFLIVLLIRLKENLMYYVTATPLSSCMDNVREVCVCTQTVAFEDLYQSNISYFIFGCKHAE